MFTFDACYLTCSAGIGRSGTFIAIDAGIQPIKHEGTVDIYNYVRSLRFWRRRMVQSVVRLQDQY